MIDKITFFMFVKSSDFFFRVVPLVIYSLYVWMVLSV